MADQRAPAETDPKREEVRRNYEAFMGQLPDLLASHKGMFALMRNGAIIEYFDTPGDAHRVGQKLFTDGLFSIQEITDSPVDLGFFSYALRCREI